jgi:threonine dehydrogenase-like Zn-dependent dehydrogenase
LARGIVPVCANCALGWTSSCLNLDTRIVSSGRTLGFTSNLGGGWAEQTLAHSSMLHPIPDAVPDRAACLHEPVSIACHGLLRAPPDDGEPVLVVGAGIIGLATVAALKGLVPRCPVTVLARHAHQAEAAIAYVVEAVGTPQSVTEALRMVNNRGVVLLLGTAGISEVDLTPIWYKEAALVGSIDHSVDRGSTPGLAGGPGRHSIDRALDVLAAGLLPDEAVITHEFALADYRTAVEAAIDRNSSHAIKVVFRP